MPEPPIVRLVAAREGRSTTTEAAAAPGGMARVERLYLRHHDELVRLATVLTNGSADSEDLVQEVFTAFALRERSVTDALPYLRRAVVNAAIGRHRKRGREVTRAEPPPGRAVPGVDDAALDRRLVVAALAALPERQRVAVLLRHSLGWSETEVATALGCRLGTASSLATRGRAALRTALEAADAEGGAS